MEILLFSLETLYVKVAVEGDDTTGCEDECLCTALEVEEFNLPGRVNEVDDERCYTQDEHQHYLQ